MQIGEGEARFQLIQKHFFWFNRYVFVLTFITNYK